MAKKYDQHDPFWHNQSLLRKHVLAIHREHLIEPNDMSAGGEAL